VPAPRRLGVHHVVAHGGDRRHPRRPPGGDVRRDHGHHDAHDVGDDDRPRQQHQAAGQLQPERPEHGLEQLRDAQPQQQAERGADDADDERLEQHRPRHLPAAGAERPEQRHLLRALRHQDRERVEDEEHADEQRDRGEHQEERVEEAEPLLDGRCRLLVDVGAGQRLEVVRQHRADLVADLLGAGAVGRRHRDAVVGVVAADEELLRVPGLEDRQAGAGQAAALAEPDDTDQFGAEPGLLAGADELHLVADLVPGPLERALVERDLARAGRQVAVDQAQDRVAVGRGAVVPVDGDAGGALGGHEVAVAVEDEEALVLDLAVGPLDAGQRGDVVDQVGRDGRRGAGGDGEDVGLAGQVRPHDDVGGEPAEDVVERPVDGVGEHVRAGHERHAEHDGERAHGQPQLARGQALEGRADHACCPTASKPFMRSSTFSAVGSVISSTMTPSARNSTRSE
jgi:hypothetical protein